MPTTTELSSDFGSVIAARIRSSHQEIAERWLDRLKSLLPVGADEIFPSDQMLDHIPALIREIADYVGAESTDTVAANTAIQSKAHELGELRFAQKASVHQLLREYRFLGAVIAAFIDETASDLKNPTEPADAIAVMMRLNEAVFVLLQMTVDTFVGRYAERIDEQTTRLEGFNRMVSHELRQPLNTVHVALELMGSEAGRDEAKQRHYLDVASRNARRLGDLMRMLGTLVRPDHDNPQVQTVDLSKIVGEALRQVRDEADAKGVELRNRVEPLNLTLDVARLELVLVNLLSNGIKYRDPAKAEAFVEVGVESADTAVQIRVRDNGLGIPAAHQGKVFRRFFRAYPERDSELGTEGVGLGLAIVSECVKAMRGKIGLESAENTGTTFIVTLPVDSTLS
jgi:signal transduction histidine kinase